jgi:hypothetical protein
VRNKRNKRNKSLHTAGDKKVRDMSGKRGKALPVKPAGWLWRRRGLLMCSKKRGEMTVTRLGGSPRERFKRFNGLERQEAGTQHRCEATICLSERNCCAAIFSVLPRRRPDCCGVRGGAVSPPGFRNAIFPSLRRRLSGLFYQDDQILSFPPS